MALAHQLSGVVCAPQIWVHVDVNKFDEKCFNCFFCVFLFLRAWGFLASTRRSIACTCWATQCVSNTLVVLLCGYAQALCATAILASVPSSCLTYRTIALFQVTWWLNLACLGLYALMVAVASVSLQRGVCLGQKRRGRKNGNVQKSVVEEVIEIFHLSKKRKQYHTIEILKEKSCIDVLCVIFTEMLLK